ncbi:phosphatase PAP2 family protein [Streptomyces sp. HPF1205]|uniref:phosphatase PAP2 family protein n=1 Tax=Streptomyces sp. HPF1205 TaxID=2873262 RepID=UPI001CECD80F|nr:phosphatase PAP2 family protein [Streptomyces sp. HPF1205]
MNPPRTRRRIPARYVAVTVVAALAASAGIVGPAVGLDVGAKKSAARKIQADPPPPLFSDADTAPIAAALAAQQRVADRLIAQWQAAHGTTRDDTAFTAWAEAQIPRPPSGAEHTAELRQDQDLARHRTSAGVSAATWLEIHGKKDIWKMYAKDQGDLLPKAAASADKSRLKAAMKLAGTLTKTLAAKYASPAPYVQDPALRPDKKITPGQPCPCSYPSKHAALSAAAATVLTQAAPRQAAEYRWMAAQVVYSRLYMAGHFRGDVLAGALLGDLVGDYSLLTAGLRLPTTAATPPVATEPPPATPAPRPSPTSRTADRPAVPRTTATPTATPAGPGHG